MEVQAPREPSPAVKSGKRPMFAVGNSEEAGEESSDAEESEDGEDSLGELVVRRKTGRVVSLPLPDAQQHPAAAARKTTVVYQQPVTVVPMSEGSTPASSVPSTPGTRSVRFFSDSQIPTLTATRICDGRSGIVFHAGIVGRWRRVVARAMSQDDPWRAYGIQGLAVTPCLRHRYSSIRKAWVVDRVEVKMEEESFARGAMRKCFRLKKLSTGRSFRNNDWEHALNYVAKSYIEPVEKATYFEDVKLQMDAKLWAEEYNRHLPPKKVDIFQISILEFEEGQMESRFYHLEHFIEGDYQKYNSNSGFVDEVGRQTPQAFSHFTFERSGHQQIVVDVQGVGDLYTDPQIHTLQGQEYGDGNLGTKGMALFFHSHTCNDICKAMGLTPFDLAPTEWAERKKRASSAARLSVSAQSRTVCRGLSKLVQPMDDDAVDVIEVLRARTISERTSSNASEDGEGRALSNNGSDTGRGSLGSEGPASMEEERCPPLPPVTTNGNNISSLPPSASRRRVRMESELDASLCSGEGGGGSGASSVRAEALEKEAFWLEMRKKSRPAGLMGLDPEAIAALEAGREAAARKRREDSQVLGQIHLDVARYHELGRFLPTDAGESGLAQSYDAAAAWFHLDMAAKCSVPLALLTCARIYLGLPHDDCLPDFSISPADEEERLENEDQALEYLSEAAEAGDRGAALFLAEAYTTGAPLGTERAKSAAEAAKWLEKALALTGEDEERYQIQASLGELYMAGGEGLKADPMKAGDLFNEAAEGAMEAGKGKLSTKLYAKSEEAWALVPEEDAVEE